MELDGTRSFEPIGYFESSAKYPYDVPRQGAVSRGAVGVIRLVAGKGYEEGLCDLSGFSHIWVLYVFHRNEGWRPKVRPPRHVDRKVGVFASRSPYRPNPLGISAVRLEGISGLEVWISHHDLLSGTPILDIKPYLSYADSFPEASLGWTGEGGCDVLEVVFLPRCEVELSWLESHGVDCIRQFIVTQLEYEPMNGELHRLVSIDGEVALAYRTWRALFQVSGRQVLVREIRSGYDEWELSSSEDKYKDKELHRQFREFQQGMTK